MMVANWLSNWNKRQSFNLLKITFFLLTQKTFIGKLSRWYCLIFKRREQKISLGNWHTQRSAEQMHKSINMGTQISGPKNKTHMIISIDAEIAFEKTTWLWESRTRTYLSIIKAAHDKPNWLLLKKQHLPPGIVLRI